MRINFSPDCSGNPVIARNEVILLCDCFVPRNDRLQRKAGTMLKINAMFVLQKKLTIHQQCRHTTIDMKNLTRNPAAFIAN